MFAVTLAKPVRINSPQLVAPASPLFFSPTPRIIAAVAAGTPPIASTTSTSTRRTRNSSLSIITTTTTTTKRLFTTTLPHRQKPSPPPPQQPAKMSVSTAMEAEIKRNPHPDFKQVEASRPDWDTSSQFRYTKTPDPSWTFGSGANHLASSSSSSSSSPDDPQQQQQRRHIQIDPYEAGRPGSFNYKLLISSVVPRPIGFVSTVSADGARRNLAPFSYFQVVCHDPPTFVAGVAAPLAAPKDTLRNLVDTRECVVAVVSEHFAEAANAASVDAPYGADEWAVSGLTPLADCVDVRPPRVAEAVFSVECRLESVREFESRSTPGKKSGCLVVLEGTRFWVREDAINEERNLVDPAVLRPVSRLGGITYGRVTEAFELLRPVFEKDVGGMAGYEKLREQAERREKERERESKGEEEEGGAGAGVRN
ncbi:hypothetical protein F4809DRAFT_623836 [Biscogniauxia mediterranea]|nr:hypothetical protein F4809DRAFT_623836 [Biscogniauxia mediterranea]